MSIQRLLEYVEATGTEVHLAPTRHYPLDPDAPIADQMADAIRCTSHIEGELRAKYILQDMKLRGFVFQRVRRDSAGHFVSGGNHD